MPTPPLSGVAGSRVLRLLRNYAFFEKSPIEKYIYCGSFPKQALKRNMRNTGKFQTPQTPLRKRCQWQKASEKELLCGLPERRKRVEKNLKFFPKKADFLGKIATTVLGGAAQAKRPGPTKVKFFSPPA